MEPKAMGILDSHGVMSISTLRPDGRPQTTNAGYANDRLIIYVLILRAGPKFDNIRQDDRGSVAIGKEPRDRREAKAVFAGAHASEVTDPQQRHHAWRRLVERHPNLADSLPPKSSEAAMMSAGCRFVSIVDRGQGGRHSDAFTTDVGGAAAVTARQ